MSASRTASCACSSTPTSLSVSRATRRPSNSPRRAIRCSTSPVRRAPPRTTRLSSLPDRGKRRYSPLHHKTLTPGKSSTRPRRTTSKPASGRRRHCDPIRAA
jgi:hypothetical protein